MKKMQSFQKLLSLLLALTLFVPQAVFTSQATGSVTELPQIEASELSPYSPISPYAVQYSAIIMQGNTNEEDDCNAVYTYLKNNGTYRMTPIGWTRYTNGTSSINTQRVTSTQFRISDGYDVAYYSGHGAKSSGYPVLNASASNQSGTSSPFNVASLLGVSGSNWRNESLWNTGDSLKVLILASCHQLDSSIMKYYARLMRASNIRAVAGYHSTGPGHPTDVNIANDFFAYANAGNSIWYSWQHANEDNGNKPWAVLVYQSNANQYYRLPGFPGRTYSAPSSTASVYRYASHLGSSYEVVPTSVSPSPNTLEVSSAAAAALPLTIRVEANNAVDSAVEQLGIENRESVDPTTGNLALDSSATDEIVEAVLNENMLDNVVLYQYPVVRCEVDPDTGAVEGTDVIVQRTYKYYNTYNGVRINNSSINFTVDANGIAYVANNWKDVSVNQVSVQTMASSTVDVQTAINNITEAGYSGFSDAHVDFVYEPDEDGYCKLCYEVQNGDDVLLVDVATGEVLE